ncbi:MAG: HAD-IA family hydrolase [Pseudomonadota bacterium]
MTTSDRALAAILWDFGGVLTTSPFEAFNRFEEERGLPKDFIRRVNATNPTDNAWARFESSLIDRDTFDVEFQAEAKALGHNVSGREVLRLLSGEVRPRMVAALDRCKSHYRVGCITNNVKTGSGPGMARDQQRASAVEAVMARFDVVIESSLEGVRKPDPAIYYLACDRMQVEPSACAFLDDLGINLKPAAALGMRTIKVVSEAQALADLTKLTGLSFD